MSFDTAAGIATAKWDKRLFADSESKTFFRTIPQTSNITENDSVFSTRDKNIYNERPRR